MIRAGGLDANGDPLYAQLRIEELQRGNAFEAYVTYAYKNHYPTLSSLRGGSASRVDGTVGVIGRAPIIAVATTGQDARGNLTYTISIASPNE
jgi:hypothetical protein